MFAIGMKPYGDTELRQLYTVLGNDFYAWRQQAITWTNIDYHEQCRVFIWE